MARGTTNSRKRRAKRRGGFALIEVLVSVVLVSVAVVGVLGEIRAVNRADAQANTASLLQRLASEKLGDLEMLSDPSTNGTSGDFSDRAQPDIQWSADVEASGADNVDKVTVTVTRGHDTQALTTLMYVAPSTASSTSGTTTTGGTTP